MKNIKRKKRKKYRRRNTKKKKKKEKIRKIREIERKKEKKKKATRSRVRATRAARHIFAMRVHARIAYGYRYRKQRWPTAALCVIAGSDVKAAAPTPLRARARCTHSHCAHAACTLARFYRCYTAPQVLPRRCRAPPGRA